MKTYEYRTAVDVKEGSILIKHGFRCRASNVRHLPESQFSGVAKTPEGVVARYTLTSEPNADYPRQLPLPYEGGTYGGNSQAVVCIEVDLSHEYEEPKGFVRN